MPIINKIKVGETEYDVQDKRIDGGVVPLLKALDAREEAETGRPWFTQPQNAYPRVYTESTATKAPYNKHFLTDRPVAPVDPDGRLAEYGKGVYFMKMDEVRGADELTASTAVKASSTDSPYVSFSATDSEGLDWLTIHKTETGGERDREVWIYPTTSDNSLGDGKKVIVEFDMKMESWSQLSGETYDKGWTFKIAPLFDGNRAITTSAAANSSLLIYVEPTAIRVRVNNVAECTYKLDLSGIFNFKLALFNKKYYLYINDYLMGVGDSVLNTDTSLLFNRMGIFLNAKDSVKFSIANLFCGIVEGEDELSGRYLGSIPVRRQNKHILVPSKLSDYVSDKLEGLDPSEYALSYGAAQEMIANAGGGATKIYKHSLRFNWHIEAADDFAATISFNSTDPTPINNYELFVANAEKIKTANIVSVDYFYFGDDASEPEIDYYEVISVEITDKWFNVYYRTVQGGSIITANYEHDNESWMLNYIEDTVTEV